jgi:transcriptional regulator with XRE-family HTH domain
MLKYTPPRPFQPAQTENNAVTIDVNLPIPAVAAMDMKTGRPTLGRLLRDLRARNGWTLKEMSERTEIPISTLSKVEHDRLTLTYDKLLQVSEGLEVPLSELFADPTSNPASTEAAVTARRSLGYLADAVRVNTRNYDYYYMCPELRRKRMIPVIGRIRAKSLAEFGELIQHSGEEYIYVLEGGHRRAYIVLRPGFWAFPRLVI